jgi:hypothetical protein
MGNNRQQRRAAHQRRAAQQQRSDGAPSQSHDPSTITEAQVRELLLAAAHHRPASGDPVVAPRVARALLALEAAGTGARPLEVLSAMLVEHVTQLYELGWQPADVVHAVRRKGTARTGRLAVGLVAHEARGSDAVHRAPGGWLAQLDDVGARDPGQGTIVGGHQRPLATWARVERLDPDEVLEAGVAVLAVLARAYPLPRLMPPPSGWGATNRGTMAIARSLAEVDQKALTRIRALLAKAESTTFDAEAEAFTAKAQELMTRCSIDAAVLAAATATSDHRLAAGVESRRVHIEDPYADEKAELLAVIASVNGARCVWAPHIGLATVMGFPVDLQLTDVLFTSLLVQATRASAAATSVDRRLRTASFRRAFLVAFAVRIGERLERTRRATAVEAEQTYGSSLAPVLASRQAAVEEAMAEAFPNTSTTRRRSVDAAGWHAGRAAADVAHLGIGDPITERSG